MNKLMEQMKIPGLDEAIQGSSGRGQWEMVRIQDICSLITDGTHQTPTYSL